VVEVNDLPLTDAVSVLRALDAYLMADLTLAAEMRSHEQIRGELVRLRADIAALLDVLR
jgi:hypothetical protein